jgi:hypothetical protein
LEALLIMLILQLNECIKQMGKSGSYFINRNK